ncbi:MAG: 50S ribosomal protein L13 [Spirochaetaceae bacterium]|jgi:large subunit ribosomal protein L13|nr:50S ribosomal protein L13 [Spirochaetaceae bacterium]
MKTVFIKPAEAERKWFVIDAEGKALGRVAAKAASIVRGKEKPTFAPHQEIGDFVVVVNAGKILITGRKAQQKRYYRHSGYVGGLKSQTFEKLIAKQPDAPLQLAVKGMLPKGPLGRKLLKNVKVYPGASHPHAAQNPQLITLP